MKTKYTYIAFFIALSFIFSCRSSDKKVQKENTATNEVTKEEATTSVSKTNPGASKATVVSYQFDGCSWILLLENGKKLQPNKLPPEFQKDQLKVWIKFVIQKNVVSTCMTGDPIALTEIELR